MEKEEKTKTKTEIQNQHQKTKKQAEEQFRVVISREANAELERLVARILDGHDAVTVSKSDIGNYIFCNLNKHISDADIQTIRVTHFDERKVLQGLMRRSSQEDEIPSDLKKIIRDFYGIGEKDKKRPSRRDAEP